MEYYKINSRIALKDKQGYFHTKNREIFVKSELGSADVLLNIFGKNNICLPGEWEKPNKLRFYHSQQGYVYIEKLFDGCFIEYKDKKYKEIK